MDTIQYKGFNIEIVEDENCASPQEWGDDSLFLVSFHRDFSVITDDIKDMDDLNEIKDYWQIPLYAYIHSGVSLSISRDKYPYNDRWDSCQVGVVLASKKEFKTMQEAVEASSGLVKNWNDYLSGNVWGYIVDEIGASCYGYYGDYEDSGLIEDAKSEINFYLEKLYDKKNKKLKDLIKSKVKIEKRENILLNIK